MSLADVCLVRMSEQRGVVVVLTLALTLPPTLQLEMPTRPRFSRLKLDDADRSSLKR
jgi:hypothetical protein